MLNSADYSGLLQARASRTKRVHAVSLSCLVFKKTRLLILCLLSPYCLLPHPLRFHYFFISLVICQYFLLSFSGKQLIPVFDLLFLLSQVLRIPKAAKMVVVPTEAEVLQNLCSKDQLELLNSIDTLRAQGISSFVSLPQIIVCGDQSSGKSSVLEAISGVPFPAKSTMCTRFPTELVLRKAKEEGVSVSIVADPGRKIEDRESISKFNGSQDVSDGVPALIEKAKAAMGILPEGKAFARDVLRIEVSGPDRPQLTIVDLPGLIHSPTKQQSAFDVDLVQQLVHEYMKKTRSVILAVVSAKNDYANQVVLKLARAADQKGYRSLGVITKPDMLVPSSSSERAFIQLANNEDVSFRLGWHVLKNMDTEKGQSTLRERDAQEREFFDTGVWTTLPPMHLGIGSLRQRLSKVLLDQIVMELPSLAKEIDSKSNECSRSLGQLGKARTTVMEQRAYLMQSSQEFQVLVKAAVDGTYNHTFFGDPNSNLGYRKRIRAIIQNMNIDFAADIMRRGQLQEIASENPKESSDERLNSSKKKITRKAYVERVIKLMERTRGRELPGTFNPMIVKDLFAEQCKPWHNIANNHIEGVWKAAKDFLGLVMSAIADEMTSKSVFQRVFTPALDSIWETLRTKTDELLATHHEGHPITYNHYFTENLQKIRSKNEKERFVRILREKLPVTDNGWIDGNLDIGEVADALLVRSEPDMDRFAALEAIDCMEAYYKVTVAMRSCSSFADLYLRLP